MIDKDKIGNIVQSYGDKLVSDINRTWNSLNSIDGNADATFKIISTQKDSVVGRLEATGQKAWIVEFGKGSLMDNEAYNPYLSRYKHNPRRWNKLRKGHFVTGRPKEPYQDLDNNIHYPSGRLAGRNLEQTGIDAYKPSKPYHVIHDVITKNNALKALFKEHLTNTIKQAINIEVKRK